MIPSVSFIAIVGLIVGHGLIGLAVLSRFHALGLNPKWTNRAEVLPLAIPAIIALGFVWLIVSQRFDAWPWFAQDYAYGCTGVALAFPFIVLARRLRGQPKGVSGGRVETVLIAKESINAGWIGEGKHAWMLRLPGNESLAFQMADWDLAHPSLPARFGPLRILHISDLHFARCYSQAYFEAVADAASGWDADLVVFTGDLLDDDATIDWTLPVLGKLRGRLGQYAILGNHDVLHRPGRVRRAIRSAGFDVIDGRWARIVDGDRSIAIGGTSFPWGPQLDPHQRPDADATIVLSHTPDRFPSLARWGTVDLVLSGHNHGGQVRLPLIGPLVMPSLYGCRYDREFFRRGRTVLEVTQGIGGKHPLRYGCPPEVVRLVLRPSVAASSRAGSSRVRRMSDSTSRTSL